MEIENEPLRPGNSRPRSSRRLRHEAQIKVFKDQVGDLEKIRLQVGLRPSQICEILKVHPSAWTRWTKGSRSPPPHVFQMLEWYLELLKWRGQHVPALSDLNLHPFAHQDPHVLVPPPIQFASNPNGNLNQPVARSDMFLATDSIFSGVLGKALISTWVIQLLTWVLFAIYVWRKS